MTMRRKTNRKGFTLGEILAVVAIIGILLAVAIPNVLGYARRLKLSELDDDAMAIYMAAQSRLNAMVAAGENISGTLEGHDLVKTSPVSADVTEGGVERQYVSNAVGNAGAPGSTTGNYASLLPSLSVDQELLDHSYVVEYDALTGMVYAVWYWEEDGFDYGEVMKRPEEGDSGYDKNKDMTLLENRSREKLMVGYYGGTDVDRDGVKRMPKFDLTVTNAEELTLKIVTHAAADASMDIKNEDFLVDVSINGYNILTGQNLIPGNTGLVVLDTLKSDAYKPTTDSLTDGTGFTIGAPYKDWWQDAQDKGQTLPLPGADIVLTVTLRHAHNEYLPRVLKVACNSLFAGIDSDRRAMIKYGRHLQNLDSATSGVNDEKDIDGDSSRITVLTARQIAHIDFKEDKEDSWNKVYGYDRRKFTPITNNHLTEYNGNGYMIRYLNAGIDSSFTNSGLFGSAFTGETYKNIELVNPSVQGFCAGALIGSVANGTIDNCHAYLDAQGKQDAINGTVFIQGKEENGLAYAGGLVGMAVYSTITDSSASLVVSGITAGGLVGTNMDGQISNCYAAGSVSGTDAVGGLIGLDNVSTISHSYAAGLISCAGANSVGGIVGNIALGGATPNISDSYAAVRYTETTGSPTIYGVCQGNPAACYIRQNGVQYAENSGNPATKADISALDLTGDWKILTANTSTVAYNLTAQTRRLDVYPYPRFENEAVHYGDWLEQNNAVLVYFEKIGGAYSVYGKLLEDTGEVTWNDLFPTFGKETEFIDELKNSGVVTYDGYGILLPGDGELQPTVMKGEKTVTLQNLNAKVDFQNEEYSLYAFQGDDFDGGDYYQTIKIGDYEYTYNKFFPCEVFTEADKPVLTNPAEKTVNGSKYTGVLIRSARHVANMSGHGPSGCNYAQQLDVDFNMYATDIMGKSDTTKANSAALNGAYNGNGHTIRNMFLSGSGLFSYVSGTVSNLTLDTVTVTGSGGDVGGLTGSVTPAGTISKVTLINVTVTGSGGSVGGLAGSLKGTATDITLTGSTVTGTGTGDVGGLAGTVADKGQVLTAALTGVKVTGNQNAGGLAGTVAGEGKIDTSTLTNVKVTGNQNAGGLVGLLSGGTLDSCGVYAQDVNAYDALTVHGGASSGGLIGQMSGGAVDKSFAAVKVSGGTAGGFVGSATGGTIQNSYSGGRTDGGVYTAGTVNVKGVTAAGGFAGNVQGVTFEGICYSTCSAQAPAVGQFAASGKPTGDKIYALGMTFTGDSPVAPTDKDLPAPVSGSVTAKTYGMAEESYPFASPQTEHHGDWPVRKKLVYREVSATGEDAGPLIVDYYMIEGAGEGTPYAMDGVSGTANGDGWLSWEIHNAEPTGEFYRTIYINGYRYYFNPHFAYTVQETMPEGAPKMVQINSARQLANISRYTSAGYGKNWTYMQGRDIDYALYNGWDEFTTGKMPDNDSRQAPIELVNGNYYGIDGYTYYIKNLYLGSGTMGNNEVNGGLFGRISSGSTVSNVTLINVSVDVSADTLGNKECAGALVGRVEKSYVINCGIRVDVTDYTTIESDYTNFGVYAPGTDNVGGLIGAMNDGSSVTNSYAAVKVAGKDAVGGFVGYLNGGTVSNCYAGGHTIKGVYDATDANVIGSNAGGFVGKVDGTTTFEGVCYSTCSASGTSAGAFVASGKGTIEAAGATLYGAGDAFGATNKSYNTPVPATDKVERTVPYDVNLRGKDYPYMSGHSVHYGDWKNNKITFGVFYRDTCSSGTTGYYIRVWQTRDDGTLEQYFADSLCRDPHEGTIQSPQYGYFCTDGVTVSGAAAIEATDAERLLGTLMGKIPKIDTDALTGLQAYVVSGSGEDSWTFTYSAGSVGIDLNHYFGNTISGQKEIRTLQQLKNIDNFLYDDFTQTHDIDASTMNTPIASNSAFTGHYDGGGYQLKDIYISVNGEKAALFATANGGYAIKNVFLNGGTIAADNSRGKARAAGIVADSNDNDGTISNCIVALDSITARGSGGDGRYTTYAGGISANFTGTIQNCEVNAKIRADAHSGREYAGGLVAELNNGTIALSYSGGTIQGASQSGGIVGNIHKNASNATITYCYTCIEGAKSAIAGGGNGSFNKCKYDKDRNYDKKNNASPTAYYDSLEAWLNVAYQ